MFSISLLSHGQINTTISNAQATIEPYDSTQNFLERNTTKYIGQELYLVERTEDLRKYGYDDFFINPNETLYSLNGENIYKCCDGFKSKYDELAGKYFKVIAVHEHPYDAFEKDFLELEEKTTGDKVFFSYNTRYKSSFPFVVVGYFEKQKKEVVGKSYVFSNILVKDIKDMTTGKPITFIPNQKWDCIDLTIDVNPYTYYNVSLVVKNRNGEQTLIPIEYLSDNRYGFSYKSAKSYESKFGLANWLKILDGKVAIGFTEEMAVLSWGKPIKINHASYGDQWVYEDQYLYFKQGKLTSFN